MRPAKNTPWTGGSGTSKMGLLRDCLGTVPGFHPQSWPQGSLPLPSVHAQRDMYTDTQTHTHIRTHTHTDTCKHRHGQYTQTRACVESLFVLPLLPPAQK